jgi:predicted transposase/invertase (TIGR01784 family)
MAVDLGLQKGVTLQSKREEEMKKGKQLIRFDWAIKHILRDKLNFGILNGFLSELLREPVSILKVLPGDSNKDSFEDKSNNVDILVENHKGELILIEIQV